MKFTAKSLPASVLRRIFASAWARRWAHRLFMRFCASPPCESDVRAIPLQVLVVGVYLADRPHTAGHLVRELASGPGLEVEHRWVALRGGTEDLRLRQVTQFTVHEPTPKFALINRLLVGLDLARFDYVIVVDDDIEVQAGTLPAFLAHQQKLGFALAQPARALHSHFDHFFVVRRPWLAARQTRFVECGPWVSFNRDAVRLLLPFDSESEMWGMDLVWPVAIQRGGLTMGIIDAIPVDHSMRGQATTYDRSKELAMMAAFLAKTPHVSAGEVFAVLKRYPAAWRTRYF